MESQPRNPEFKINLEIFHPSVYLRSLLTATIHDCIVISVLINFANSLDPDQDRQSGSKLFDTLIVRDPERFFLKKVNF